MSHKQTRANVRVSSDALPLIQHQQTTPQHGFNSPAFVNGMKPYLKALNAMAIIFASLTFVAIIIAVATKIKVAFNGSNLLGCFNLVTAFLSIVWINESFNRSPRMITARFWVSISCLIFVSVYVVFQATSIAQCHDHDFLSANPVEKYLCEEEFVPLICTVVYAGIVLLAIIAQLIIDLKLRAFVVMHIPRTPSHSKN